MKCCHLVAALALVGCGLDTGVLPTTGRGADAGAGSSEVRKQAIAGSPASWPTRRRSGTTPAKDAGSADPQDASTQPNRGGSNPSSKPNQDAQVNPNGQTDPSGQAIPGGQSGPSGQSPSTGSQSQPSGSNAGPPSPSSPDAGAVDAGSTPADPDESSSGQAGNGNGSSSSGNGSNGSQGSIGSGWQPPAGGGTRANGGIGSIVDLVLAILDLSLGPIRPAEIEALVSSILVLSLAPAELAADSLVAVLDALELTRICIDHPERCNPLCTNLESDCSACGHDQACIERVEEMCRVQLPRSCH